MIGGWGGAADLPACYRALRPVRPKPPPGFIQPSLPTRADKPPCSETWLHEIKHDGFRMMVRRDAAGVRLTRNGIDWTTRFPLIAEAAAALRVKSFLVDGRRCAAMARGCRCSTGCALAVTTGTSSSTHSTCCR
jgi:ATP-dependent DNA ligase